LSVDTKMEKNKVVIIDYDLGNLFSVQLACESVGLNVVISSDRKYLTSASAIILPGVGSFRDSMRNLHRFDLISPIRDFVEAGKPMMGVCLGMQLLFSGSEEFGNTAGLDLIKGEIKKLKSIQTGPVKVPQIGWNNIQTGSVDWGKTPLRNIAPNSFMYFVHSFYAQPNEDDATLTTTDYGVNHYCSSVFKNNIFATQFHPEKSTEKGVGIYKEWAIMNNLI
jgi:imidazole glycerol-phosphate synthase subunit HisH